MPLRLDLPPRGTLTPNNDVDPLAFYYKPVVGRVFRARIDLGLGLLVELAGDRTPVDDRGHQACFASYWLIHSAEALSAPNG